MITSHISITDVKDPRHDLILAVLESAKGAYVTIGIHDGAGQYADGTDVLDVALWNEFGTSPRMVMTEGGGAKMIPGIPERSFLRKTIDENMAVIDQYREEAVFNIIEKGWSVKQALDSVGFKIQILVQNKIGSNVPPPNKPSTVAHKLREGIAPNTLIETKLLQRSVTFKTFGADVQKLGRA